MNIVINLAESRNSIFERIVKYSVARVHAKYASSLEYFHNVILKKLWTI